MAAGLCVAASAEGPLFADSPFAATVQTAVESRGALADPTAGNSVAIIDSGYDALLLRVHLIRNARQSIAVQTFIWTNDECGRLLMYELIEAARRGVRVRIIADHLASDKDSDTVAFLGTAHPNLDIKHYRPAASRIKPSILQTVASALRSVRGANQRMHNKIMVFDDTVLITGGRNIENSYYGHSTEMNFKDRDVLAIGPAAAAAGRSFEEYWECRYAVSSRDLVDVAAAIKRDGFRRYMKREDWDFGPFFQDLCRQADAPEEIRSRFLSRLHRVKRAEFLADKPGKNSSFFFSGQGRITRQLTDTLWQAKDAVIMQSPYLVLSGKAHDLFAMMRTNRPNLRIIVSSNSFGSTDNTLAYSANYRLRASYIEGLGMEIHEYKPLPDDLLAVLPAYPQLKRMGEQRQAEGKQSRLPFLCIHAKSLVIDDHVAFIGSFNLDPRSENLNTEAGLLLDDAQIAAELKQEILRDARAGNSWTIAKRAIPLQLDKVNRLVDQCLGLLPIDIWPLQNTSSYEVIPGRPEVPPSHPDFPRNYREAGDFPGAPPGLSTKEILTRLYKAIGPLVTPMI